MQLNICYNYLIKNKILSSIYFEKVISHCLLFFINKKNKIISSIYFEKVISHCLLFLLIKKTK